MTERAEQLFDLSVAVEKFVAEHLPSPDTPLPADGKAIHDAVWGTHVFRPWEVAMLDTPLLQRLRRVKQTSFAFLTYPAANHTRFEHSLGVVVTADRLLNSLESSQLPDGLAITQGDRATVRLAALLHDVGHVCMAHIGEQQIKQHPWIIDYRATLYGRWPSMPEPKPHELLSHAIIQSEAFSAFFASLVEHYAPAFPMLAEVSLQEVAAMIVGASDSGRLYLADVINGNFDADKLDYLIRDSYFTGLRLNLDTDRLLYAMAVVPLDERWFKEKCKRHDAVPDAERRREHSEGVPYRLVVRSAGVSALEQILFAKMQLYLSVYHHQKIRAADSVFTSYVDCLKNTSPGPDSPQFDTPIDYLSATDLEWLYGTHGSPQLESIADSLKERRLRKRALVISSRTVKDGNDGITRLTDSRRLPAIRLALAQRIIDTAAPHLPNHKLTKFDIILDIPDQPSLREASETPVLMPDSSIGVMSEVFPIDKWLTAYLKHKWHAHIFCPAAPEQQRYVLAKASRDVLRELPQLWLELTPEAWRQAHLDPERVEAAYQD